MLRLIHVLLFIFTLSVVIIRTTRGLSIAVDDSDFNPFSNSEFHEPGPESEEVQSYFDADSNSRNSPENSTLDSSKFNPLEFKPHLDHLVETSNMFGFGGVNHREYKVLMLFKEKGISYIFKEDSTEKRPAATVDDVRKSVNALERLVTAADSYRDLMNRLSKASKVFSIALKEYGSCKGLENKHVICMQTTSQFYDCQADVLSKLNKALQKDFEVLQKFWDKYSKKVTKDERDHNGHVKDLDKQVKKIGKEYEKKSKKDPTVSLDSHNNYLRSISTVGTEITRARAEYTDQVTKRERRTHSVITQIVCRLAEGQFASFNDTLKKCGPHIAKMKEWAPFAGEDMPLPQGLDDFLEDQPATPHSDQVSTNSENAPDSLASISEKQLAAMNYSSQGPNLPEPTLPIVDDDPDGNVPTKYVQMPRPKVVSPIPTKPFSPSTIVTQVGGTPGITPVSPVKQLASKSASDLLSGFSIGVHADDHPFYREKEVEVKATELYTENRVVKAVSKPSAVKTKIEEKPNIQTSKVTKNRQKEDAPNEDAKNIPPPAVDNKPIQIKKNLQSETPPPKEFMISRKAVLDDGDSTLRNNNSTLPDDESNVAGGNLKIQEPHDAKPDDNESNEINISKEETKLVSTSVDKDETIGSPQVTDDHKLLISETPKVEVKEVKVEKIAEIKNAEDIICELKDEKTRVAELKNEQPNTLEPQNEQSNLEKQDNDRSNKPFNKDLQEKYAKQDDSVSSDKESRTFTSISTDSLMGSFPTDLPIRSSPLQKDQRTIIDYPENDLDLDDRSYSRSPPLSPRPIHDDFREINSYERHFDDRRGFPPIRKDYRDHYRHDIVRYEDDRRYDDPNRYSKREIVHRDYEFGYDMQPYGSRGRYDEPIRNPSFDPRYRQRRDPDDEYGGQSYYGPPRLSTPYGRDRSPPRRHDPYACRSYTDPCRPGSSVADIRDRFQSNNEERRPLSSPRDFPIPRSGRVNDLTLRFGGTRNELRNDPHNSPTLSRNMRDYQYNVGGNYRLQSSYREERYIDKEGRYNDVSLHSRQCDCYDCLQQNTPSPTSPTSMKSPSPFRPYHNDSQRNLRQEKLL
ncbi:14202_t:CDS:2 [Acaulospora colombiana]|uniref:14202_t:CDS:1 n=1 Tax=Acaulospora colombiana TaxID=27376 RepID=A0ACA9JYF3_9GLOM|nr:14202_t:CDS:2 [Acaulospora colombiana]